METESPEQAGASWVSQQGLGRVARLHLPAVPDAARRQGGGGEGWGEQAATRGVCRFAGFL